MTVHTILVVDDNPLTRQLVSAALADRGHRVFDAPDAQTALELTERHQPDVILQDLVLADADSFALVGELRKRAKEGMAVLAFSGFTSRRDQARISAVGFDDVIVKPIEAARLVPLVEAHLPHHREVSAFGLGRRLLVVDDDAAQLKLTRVHLEGFGFTVATASNGAAALAAAERDVPDAIVSDVLMPQLDGFGLTLAIRRSETLRDVPVLLVTSTFADDSDRELARRAGADALLLRTPDESELAEELRHIFSSPRKRRALAPADWPELEAERTQRLLEQLNRQVEINAGLVRRTAAFSAELAILTRLSEAVLCHRDVASSLDDALAACFDMGGATMGAFYLLGSDGVLRSRPLGATTRGAQGDLHDFFGHEADLRRILGKGDVVRLRAGVPSSFRGYDELRRDLLARCQAQTVLLVPVMHERHAQGLLFMAGSSPELEEDDWLVFIQGVANQVSQALAVAQALLEREAAEQRARQQERLARDQSELLRLILDQAPDLITRLDRAGVVTFVNHDAPMGTREQLTGRPWLAHVPPDERASWSSVLAKVLEEGETCSHEFTLTGVDGRGDCYASRIGPLFSDGEIVGAVVMSRLITQEKEREAQLISADRMASIGMLAAGVAHEINNPLAAVISNLELVNASPEDEERETRAACLKDSLEAAHRIRAIVRDLKVFSRSEADETTPVDVAVVLDSTLRLAWNEIRHRAQVSRHFRPVPLVKANESRLGQVFLNLIVNAAQAINEGRADANEIRVSTALRDGWVTVEIADTGSGMSDEVQRRLFAPFFTTKVPGHGTGLGLSICKRIVSSLGGDIRVSSRIGRGSTFTVRLPACPPSAAPAKPIKGGAPMTRGATERGRVLVVDDDRVVLTAIERLLTSEHDVVTASSAAEALTLVRGGASFDVILCDLMMPQMTGIDLYLALEETHPEESQRMIFLTGGAFTKRAEDFVLETENLTLEKPFDIAALRSLVREQVRAVKSGGPPLRRGPPPAA